MLVDKRIIDGLLNLFQQEFFNDYFFTKNGKVIFVKDDINSDFKKELNYIKTHKQNRRYKALVLKQTPKVWTNIGLPQGEIRISTATYLKCTEGKHDVTEEEMRSLPKYLSDPLYIFKSSTVADAYVAVLKIRSDKTPLIAAITTDKGNININIITSAYAKDIDFIRREINKNNLLYKKEP